MEMAITRANQIILLITLVKELNTEPAQDPALALEFA